MTAIAYGVPSGGPATLEGDVAGVPEAVEALRGAIRAGDVDAAQALRWLAPRPPGERDLLSDMAVAEGIKPAIERLSRFWSNAVVLPERVRPIDGLEAEVYERLALPAESLPIVTVVRRGTANEPWKVVCTNEAYDERLVVLMPVAAGSWGDGLFDDGLFEDGLFDNAELTGRLPEGTQLLMDGNEGVLAHDRWLVHVRGPQKAESWPETLPGETEHLVEFAAALAPNPRDRREQLRWLLGCGAALLPHVGGHALYLRREERVLMPSAIDAILRGTATPRQAVQFWARISVDDGFVHTDGLRLLGLPEIEMERSLIDDPDLAHNLVLWLARKYVNAPEMPTLGTEISVGNASLVLLAGRRGARRGHSYGRCGAIQIARSPSALTGSRSRLRAPDELSES